MSLHHDRTKIFFLRWFSFETESSFVPLSFCKSNICLIFHICQKNPTFVCFLLLSPFLFSEIRIFSRFSADKRIIVIVIQFIEHYLYKESATNVYGFSGLTIAHSERISDRTFPNIWIKIQFRTMITLFHDVIQNIYQKLNANTLLYPSSWCRMTIEVQVSRKTASSYCTTIALMGIKSFSVNRK